MRKAMARVKVHHNQLTLPDEASRALALREDDEFDVEVVEEGVLLRLSSEARRRVGSEHIRRGQAGVRPASELAALTPEEQEKWIVEALEADEADEKRRDEIG
jgi:bifunctional DNA-binding transcriptional regulator/antitoxin component of YhaV-PrlF toxin-antitoxin module